MLAKILRGFGIAFLALAAIVVLYSFVTFGMQSARSGPWTVWDFLFVISSPLPGFLLLKAGKFLETQRQYQALALTIGFVIALALTLVLGFVAAVTSLRAG